MAKTTPPSTKTTGNDSKAVATVPTTASGIDFLQTIAPASQPKPLEVVVPVSPYLQFAHPQSKAYANMLAALKQLPQYTPVYVNGSEYTKLHPLQFIAPQGLYHQYLAKYSTVGEQVAWSYFDPKFTRDTDWQEVIDCVVLAVFGERILPARVRLKKAMTMGYKSASGAVTQASEEPGFAGFSPQHKLAASSGLPSWAWLTHTAAIREELPRGGGQKYPIMATTSTPTEAIVLNALRTMGDETRKTLQWCIDDFNKERTEITDKCPDEHGAGPI